MLGYQPTYGLQILCSTMIYKYTELLTITCTTVKYGHHLALRPCNRNILSIMTDCSQCLGRGETWRLWLILISSVSLENAWWRLCPITLLEFLDISMYTGCISVIAVSSIISEKRQSLRIKSHPKHCVHCSTTQFHVIIIGRLTLISQGCFISIPIGYRPCTLDMYGSV